MKKRIQHILNVTREFRDEANSPGERVIYFITFCVILAGLGFVGYGILMMVFADPQFFIPLGIIIYGLWHGYNRL